MSFLITLFLFTYPSFAFEDVCQYANKSMQNPQKCKKDRNLYQEYPSHSEQEIREIAQKVNQIFGVFYKGKMEEAKNSGRGGINHDGRLHRVTHSKTHGCAQGFFQVNKDIPAVLAQGPFQAGAKFPLWARFANGTSLVKDDSANDARSLSFKLLGVQGKKLLPGAEDSQTMDFVMNNAPIFFIKSPRDFLTFFDLVLNPENWLPSGVNLVRFFLTRPDERAAAQRVASAPPTSLLSERYWSGTSYAWGPYAVKYSAIPMECPGFNNYQPPVVDRTKPDFLAESMEIQLHQERAPACWKFAIQVQADPWTMPIEDATIEWPEYESPFINIGTLVIPPQPVLDTQKQEFCESLVFSNWRVTQDLRPLGDLNRLRKAAYAESAKNRHTYNNKNGYYKTPPQEPEVFDIP